MSTSSAKVTPTAPSRLLTIPNLLSLARLTLVPVFVFLFVTGRENAAVAVYAVGAWTDFFDGYLARRFGQVSEFGKLLDPFADRVFIVALALALLERGLLPWPLAAAVVARDVLVLAAWPLLERRGVPRLAVNFTGKSATGALLFGLTWLACTATTFPILSDLGRPVGITFIVLGALLYWIAGLQYAAEARRRLARIEPVE